MKRATVVFLFEALLVALVCGQALAAECPMGTESSTPGGPCDRCQDYFAGKPPNCKPCKYFWGLPVRKRDGTNVCECMQSYTGVYPKCTMCPLGTETESTGDGQKCGCTQPKDTLNHVRVSCGTCNAQNGWYERALYTNTSSTSFKYPPGKVCLYCKTTEQQTGFAVKDGKCTCDASQKYGFSLEYKGFGSIINICQKCDGTANTVLAKDGRCLCQKGYGVVPVWGFNYCVKCENGKVDKNGFCICSKGYAWSYDTSKCIQCSGPRFSQNKDGKCYCGKGYEGLTYINNMDGKILGCTKCPSADFSTTVTANDYNACVCKDTRKGMVYKKDTDFSASGCVCRWGFEPKGASCAYNAFCAGKQYKVEYWTGAQLPKGFDGKAFPASLAKAAPSATATAAGANWKAGAWPSLPAAAKSGKFAAKITRCVCLRHKDWDTQFKYAVVKAAKGWASLVIDGGQTERRKGELYDDNINLRPGVTPELPVQGKAAAGKATTIRVLAPKYNPRPGGFLSGMDSIPNIKNYEACHKVEVFYASADGAGDLKIVLPTKPEA